MATEYTHWLTYNKGHYVHQSLGNRETYVIDLKNELDTGDFLQGCVATTTSTGMTIFGATVRLDAEAGYTQPHQQVVILIPTAVGTHDIKLTSTTENGQTIVKHFDVLVEE